MLFNFGNLAIDCDPVLQEGYAPGYRPLVPRIGWIGIDVGNATSQKRQQRERSCCRAVIAISGGPALATATRAVPEFESPTAIIHLVFGKPLKSAVDGSFRVFVATVFFCPELVVSTELNLVFWFLRRHAQIDDHHLTTAGDLQVSLGGRVNQDYAVGADPQSVEAVPASALSARFLYFLAGGIQKTHYARGVADFPLLPDPVAVAVIEYRSTDRAGPKQKVSDKESENEQEQDQEHEQKDDCLTGRVFSLFHGTSLAGMPLRGGLALLQCFRKSGKWLCRLPVCG